MRYLGLLLLGLVSVASSAPRGGDAPASVKALAGSWARAAVPAADGKGNVVPRLLVKAEGKDWILNVGAERDMGDESVTRTTRYILQSEKDGEALLITWLDKSKKIPIQYTIKGDTLTIMCKQKVIAGKFLEEYDISGEWKRSK